MPVRYKTRTKHSGEFDWGTVGLTEVIEDYMTHDFRHSYTTPGIEEQLKRLREIVALVADNANLDLASLIDSRFLDKEYVVDNSPNTD